ncbi:hypothetical protein [Rhizobium gallicum]|uniref:hypothetical protein n=1 Tax=Rhizobium gallicum TaxID=56730 RepID=UPI001EF7E882|nr:hypothetical protein [Rhizobium gallicum]ULJ74204.1 hypothetical protein L2W42_22435 [Rhizobium gallicum]
MRWASFVGSLNRKLTAEQAGDVLKKELASVKVPNSPQFYFGIAARAASEGFHLDWLRLAKLDFGEDHTLYAGYGVERPAEMRAALAEMDGHKLLSDDVLSYIFASLAENLGEEETGDPSLFRERIELAAEVYNYVPYSKRTNLSVAKIFAASPFFAHLSEATNSADDPALGSAIFLAMQSPGQNSLSAPTKPARNGAQVPDDTAEFQWFSNVLTTGEGVSEAQFKRAAELHKSAAVFTRLIDARATQNGNQLADQIIRLGLIDGNLPQINLLTLNRHYDFLKSLLREATGEVLVRFDKRIKEDDIANLGINECSIGMMGDVRTLQSLGWKKVREHVAQQLQAVPSTDWAAHVGTGDHHSEVLWEMIDGSSFKVADPGFREVVVQIVLDVLAGRMTPNGPARHDLLLKAIDTSFHGDMFRQMREGAKDVNPTSLSVAVKYFTETTSHMVRTSDRLSKDEKDVLIRFFLCSALEGSVDPVLRDFEALGHAKVKDMISASQESTQEKLHGAMTVFSEPFANRDRARRLGELFYGKRKVKGFFEIWFGSGDD